MPSRARAPLSTPIRRASRASSTSAWPSPVRGSFAKPSRRSHVGSRSSRRTRCSSDGADIDICPYVNSIARPPISRAAAPSTARSTESGTTSVSSSTCAGTLPRRPRRSPGSADRPGCRELAGSTDWLWMSLSRAGRGAEAKAMLDRRPDSKPVTNAYTRRLQLYRGEIGPEAVVTPTDTDDVQVATLAYGLGNWYLLRGDKAQARRWFERSIQSGGWPAFGFIVAEPESAGFVDRARPATWRERMSYTCAPRFAGRARDQRRSRSGSESPTARASPHIPLRRRVEALERARRHAGRRGRRLHREATACGRARARGSRTRRRTPSRARRRTRGTAASASAAPSRDRASCAGCRRRPRPGWRCTDASGCTRTSSPRSPRRYRRATCR